MDAEKHGMVVPISENLLREQTDLGSAVVAMMGRYLLATPEERAQWAAEYKMREAEQREARALMRRDTEVVPLTLDALTAKLGFERGYAEHLVQPYCTCEETFDGWSYCEHARDLGWTY